MAKKKWWADLPKVEDKKYSRVPIGVKPMVNNQVTEPRGLGAVEFTGAGEDGVVQTDKPTELVRTTEGPRTIHEGEAKVENEDGSTTIVPQDRLAELENEKGIPGFRRGGNYQRDKYKKDDPPQDAPAPPPPLDFGAAVAANTPQDDDPGFNAVGVDTKLDFTGSVVDNAPVPEGDTVSAAPVKGLDFSGALGHLGDPNDTQAIATEDVTKRTKSGGDTFRSDHELESLEIRQDNEQFKINQLPERLGEVEPSEDQVGIDALRDYVEGGSEQEQAIANNVMNRLNASATVAQKQNAMKIASNPNMSQGAKNAALLQMNRDISVQRTKLAGDIANTAATRAFEATKALGTLESNLADRVLKERQVDYEQNWKVIDSMAESDPVAAAEYAQEVFPGVEYNIEAIKEGVASGKFTESNVAIEGYLDDFVVSDIENPATLNEMVDWAISSGHAANLGIDTSTPEGREKVSKMITRRMRNNDPMYQTLNNISEESLNNLFGDNYVVSPSVAAEISSTIRNWEDQTPAFKDKYNNDPKEYERQMILDDKRSKFSSTMTGVISVDPVTGKITVDPTKATSSTSSAVDTTNTIGAAPINPLFAPDELAEGSIRTPGGIVIDDVGNKKVGDPITHGGDVYLYRGKGIEPEKITLTDEQIADDPFSTKALAILGAGDTGSIQYQEVLDNQILSVLSDVEGNRDKLEDPQSPLYQALLKDPSVLTEGEYSFAGTSKGVDTDKLYLGGFGRGDKLMNVGGRLMYIGEFKDTNTKNRVKYVVTDLGTGKKTTLKSTNSSVKDRGSKPALNDARIGTLLRDIGVPESATQSPWY